MYIPNGINTAGIKTNFLTGVNGKISNLTCNYANLLQLYSSSIALNGNMNITGNINVTGNINIDGNLVVIENTYLGSSLIYSSEMLSDVSGSITFDNIVTWLDASGDIYPSLPIAPEDNLIKIITLQENYGSYSAIVQIQSPETFLDVSGSTVATFDTIGQSLTLLSVGNKWAILSNYGNVQLS
jgi:hypothetical protein